MSASRNDGAAGAGALGALGVLAGAFFVVFFLGAGILKPQNQLDEDHHITPRDGLGEFMHVWIAFVAVLVLFPGVLVLCGGAIAGSLLACLITPWRGAVYLGAVIEGTKRLVQAAAMGVLHDENTENRLQNRPTSKG